MRLRVSWCQFDLTFALPGMQPVPRSGSLWWRVHAEQAVRLIAPRRKQKSKGFLEVEGF